MPQWRVEISYSFLMDSDDLDDPGFNYRANRPGPAGDLLNDRIMLDTHVCRDNLDVALRYDWVNNIGINNSWSVHGAVIGSGADGRMIEPSEFRSQSYNFTVADVGKVIRVPGGQGGFLNARGHYKITARNGPSSVTIDGVLPRATTADLDFEIREPGDVLAVLVSKT